MDQIAHVDASDPHFAHAAVTYRAATAVLLDGGCNSPPMVDALIMEALALWAAETGRKADAENFLRMWAATRDGRWQVT
jgi:hypothetical protein